MQQVQLRFVGTTPMLQHNQRLADPLDPATKKLAALTSKRKKTDADQEEIARAEWEGGMYFDEAIGPYIPGEWVLAALRDAGKLTRMGTAVTRGVQIASFVNRLGYAGPRDLDEMWAKREVFSDRRSVGVGPRRVMRTRPRFPVGWLFSCDAVVDESVLSPEQLAGVGEQGGRLIGIGDFRQLFGRYEMEVLA